MAKYTKEEKKEYFAKLREEWQTAKSLLTAGEIKEIEAIIINHGMEISAISYKMVAMQMHAQKLDGIPYLDAKTFKGWKENGFTVKKGESSTLSGITWIGAEPNNSDAGKLLPSGDITEEKKGFIFPKAYHLFHRSQVEAITV